MSNVSDYTPKPKVREGVKPTGNVESSASTEPGTSQRIDAVHIVHGIEGSEEDSPVISI
jgi:hypothetical protein